MDSDRNFLNQFDRHFKKINEALTKNLSTRVSLIEDIGNHSLLGAGKRLRPLLFVLSSQLCGYQAEDVYHFSTIFEHIHTASLLHDDVLDNADIRRKKPSVNHVWGNSAAVLSGDFLYSKSFDIAVGSNNIEFLKVLTETTTKMAEGQILELVHTHNWRLSKTEYLEIITAKTAVLISAACACGGIIAGAHRGVVEVLKKFGLHLGIAFQLMDDLLDYTSSEESFGKPVGKDLKEGKITLPLIYTLDGVEHSEVGRLQELFKNRRAGKADYDRIIRWVSSNGVIDRIRSEAGLYVDEAAKFLWDFPHSPKRDQLADINAYIVERSF
jgi:octaprenyl-diphosphate synthase